MLNCNFTATVKKKWIGSHAFKILPPLYLCARRFHSMNRKTRVRFAPSPTGPLHIGGLRTALYNYLFAKKHGGDFLLRIEDTDQNRFVEGAEEYIVEALQWCGIPFDEGPGKEAGSGPYRQSERKHLYSDHALELIAKGKAYYAFDTTETLDALRKEHESKGKTFIYNWHNRQKLDNSLSLSGETLQKRLEKGEEYVIRFKSPQDIELHLKDAIRGDIKIDTNLLDDKVLFKSDGMPTYHLANIVDDHLMEITHVIRGEEWLPSLALHQLLYDAFGWTAPEFAHLPLILKPDGPGKLSKRDGEKGGFPIFPLSWGVSQGYREAGFFPQAVVNFLALLGWNPGTEQEIFTLEELIDSFSLDRVHRSGARFDPDKTKWYNQQWLQRVPEDSLVDQFLEEFRGDDSLNLEKFDRAYVAQVVSLIKERAGSISDFKGLGDYFFSAPDTYAEKAVHKQWKAESPGTLQALLEILRQTDPFGSQALEEKVKAWLEEGQLPFGKVMAPLRLLIVGDLKGPHLFDIMALIGKEESISRIERGIKKLSN